VFLRQAYRDFARDQASRSHPTVKNEFKLVLDRMISSWFPLVLAGFSVAVIAWSRTLRKAKRPEP
jgi:hypothetical protein